MLDQLLCSLRQQSSEWTRTSFERSFSECDTSLLEEYLLVCPEVLNMEICCLQLFRVDRWCSHLVIVLVRRCVEVHIVALQTMTQQLHPCKWLPCLLGKLHLCSEITPELWGTPGHLTCPRTPFQRAILLPTEYHDIATQTNGIPRYS
jgi:hypothetical protein